MKHPIRQQQDRVRIDGVPVLRWGVGKDVTFVGALEAALAVTDRPCRYDDLMGWSGLAFRMRRFEGDNGQLGSTSDGVGEGPGESAAIEAATGWHVRDAVADRIAVYTDSLDMRTLAPEIVSTIDAGLPALAYPPHWNVAVIHGYEDQGKRVLLRDYYEEDAEYALDASELVPFLLLLEDRGDALSPTEAFLQALSLGVRNWTREPEYTPYNRGRYVYGAAGFRKWEEHVDRLANAGTTGARTGFVHPFVLLCMVDARRAAVRFLRDNAPLLPAEAASLRKAAGVYEEEAALLASESWDAKDPTEFRAVLRKAAALEAAAIALLGGVSP